MIRFLFIFFVIALNACKSGDKKNPDEEWRQYGNDGNRRFSSARQINLENVSKLQPAWEFSTGDVDPSNNRQLQCHPIMVHGKLYVTSGSGRVYALDAATGEQVWSFDAL
jgi:quinoprotein glucose dehydrogenase